jgi:hypothetical protein
MVVDGECKGKGETLLEAGDLLPGVEVAREYESTVVSS